MKPFAALVFAVVLAAGAPAFALSTGDAEATLRATIADLQSGNPDFSSMTPAIAESVRSHPDAGQQLAALGPATRVVAVGKTNPFSFVVTFESGVVMTWTISFDDADRINRLDGSGK